jgi:myosin heavy subunit
MSHSEKLLGAFPTHAHLAATSQPDEFVIKHYAGDVRLTSKNIILSTID